MPTPSLPEILTDTLTLVNQQLLAFATDSEFNDKLTLTFGNAINPQFYQQLWHSPDFNLESVIEIRTKNDLNGANGAFSRDTGKIYLAEEYLQQLSSTPNPNLGEQTPNPNLGEQTPNPPNLGDQGGKVQRVTLQKIASLILEEYGHLIDAEVNPVETIGDEGSIFAKLVQRETITAQQLQTLQSEDDTANIVLDGDKITIEQANNQPYLVSDINQTSLGSNPRNFINVAGTLYFIADNDVNGTELWKADPSTGVVSVVDIYAGINSSNPSNLTNVNGTLYLTANNGTSGTELWKIDPTTGNPVLIDIYTGSSSSSPSNLTNVNGTLYFQAYNLTNGTELWKIDPTTGTPSVIDIYTSNHSYPSNLINANDVLYFTAINAANGRELWKIDTATGNPVFLKDIYAGSTGSNPGNLTYSNGKLYFTADNYTQGVELWQTDGTTAGTVITKDINATTYGSSPSNFINIGGILYFTANDDINGTELWKADPSTGVVSLIEINPGSSSPNISNLTNVNGTLYLTANNGTNGTELWKIDPTTGNPVLIDIYTGASSSSPSNLTNVNGTLYFTATGYNGANYIGQELWRIDPTTGNPQVIDIVSGSGSSSPSNLTNANGVLYFVAYNSTTGYELWKIDNTTGSPVLVSDIYPGTGSSNPSNIINSGGKVYFIANNGANGTELFKIDATTGNPVLIDIYSGANSSSLSNLIDVNGTLYFTANDGVNGNRVWKVDPTTGNAVMLNATNPSSYYYLDYFTNVGGQLYFRDNYYGNGTLFTISPTTGQPEQISGVSNVYYLTNINGKLYFYGYSNTTGSELWKIDPSTTTPTVIDIVSGTGSSDPNNFTDVNGTLFFTASNSTNGEELWKLDGTGTPVLIKDIRSGSTGSSPTRLFNVNGTLYFTADNGINGVELWKSDGTTAGTVLAKDINGRTSSSSPSNLIDVNGTLYFTADDGVNGNRLWKVDPTTGNAVMLNATNPYTGSSNYLNYFTNVGGQLYFLDHYYYGTLFTISPTTGQPEQISGVSSVYYLTNINGKLYFYGQSNTTGYELWKIDPSTTTPTVIDIVSGTGSSNPNNFTDVNGTLFFTATNSTNGEELWKLDGTGTPVLVKDIRAGTNSSSPTRLFNVNGTLYFTADNGINGLELWKSDGTTAGTVLAKDINGRTPSSSPSNLIDVNGTLYFTADDGVNGNRLWKVDPTTGNAGMLNATHTDTTYNYLDYFTNVGGQLYFRDSYSATLFTISPTTGQPEQISGVSNVSYLTNINGKLYFQGQSNTTGSELWKIDPSTTTPTVIDIVSGTGSSSPKNFTDVNETLFFTASNSTNGEELWKLDGTGTPVLVKDIRSGSTGSSPTRLFNVNGTLYFTADNGINGVELWKSDGTTAGTVLAKDINGRTYNSSPSKLIDVNGTLYFTANDRINGYRLWKVDPTTGNAVMLNATHTDTTYNDLDYFTNVGGQLYFRDSYSATLFTISPTTGQPEQISGVSYVYYLTNINGKLYFQGQSNTTGYELWKIDPSTTTPTVIDIVSGTGSSDPNNFTDVNGTLFFTASNSTNGEELWKLDGTGTPVLVKDIRAGTNSSSPTRLFNVNGTLYFTADNGINGVELWKSDDTTAGTIQLEINPGASGSNVSNFINIGGVLYFTANNATSGTELWRINQTTGNPELLEIRSGSGSSNINYLTDVNGTLYFQAYNDTNGYELWKVGTNGTPTVIDIYSGSSSSSPSYLTNVNGTLYFQAYNPTNGTELWKIDPTTGTPSVINVVSGSGSSSPSNLINANGVLYFTASNATNGQELWKIDITTGNPVLLKDIYTGSTGSNPRNLTYSNGKLYFTAENYTQGGELWQTDGTTAGTVITKDINQATYGSNPSNFIKVGSTLYFTANDDINGSELWKSDPTTGVVSLIDINSGSGSSSVSNLTNVNGTLYFTANNSTNGTELWKIDPTTGNPVVIDIYTGANSSSPSYLTNVNGTLYFTANNSTNGIELWKIATTGTPSVIDVVSGSSSSSPSNLINANGVLYFTASNANGQELWKIDTATGNPVFLKDIYTGSTGSNPSNLTYSNGKLYFTADNGFQGVELWAVDVDSITTIGNLEKTGNEDQTITFTANDFSSLFNSGGGLPLATVRIVQLPSNGVLKLGTNNVSVNQEIAVANLGNLTFVPNANFNGTAGFTWNGSDGSAYAPDPSTVTLTINSVNDTPIVANPIADVSIYSNRASNVSFSANTFQDADLGDTLSYSATLADGSPLPNWLSLSGDRTFSANPAIANAGQYEIKVTAKDQSNAAISDIFVLSVINSTPTNISLSNTTIPENSPNNIEVGTLITTDNNTNDTHTYTLLNDAGGRFALDGNKIIVANTSLLDYESATQHTIRVQTTDNTGLSYQRDIVIYLSNVNDSFAGTLSFNSPTYSINENGTTNAQVTIQRSNGSEGTVSVNVLVSNGSATYPSDYSSTSINVIFANGETTKTVNIPIFDDLLDEDDETLNLTLSNPTNGANLGTQSTAVVTIVDNDNATISFSASSYSVNEDGTPINAVTITRAGSLANPVSVTLIPSNGTATNADYTANPITVNFASNETSKTVVIPITDDSLIEGNETINLTLSNPTGGATLGTQTTAVLTIVDNDTALSFSNSTYTVYEDGTVISAVTINRTGSLTNAVAVTVTPSNGTADSNDYTSTPITVNFGTGQNSKTVTIPINNDTVYEPTETVNLTLSNPTGGATLGTQTTAVLNIVDDNDNVPDLIVSNITAPVEVISGQQLEISWTDKNQGVTAATGTWYDYVYLQNQNGGQNYNIGAFEFVGSLAVGESIDRSQTITLPIQLQGNYKVVVTTNYDNSIIEGTQNQSNNTTTDDRNLKIQLSPVPNLQVSSITAPPSAFSSQETVVQWTVKNVGTGATNASVWYDKVYLSLDQIYDNTDTYLGYATNSSYLNPSDSYNNSLTVKLPRGIDSNYYFLINTDANNNVTEVDNEGDNWGSGGPTDVNLTPPPDLQVTSVNAPSGAFSGQTMNLSWTVTNQGSGRTLESVWYDRVFMSEDNVLDNSDRNLGTFYHSGALNADQSYTGTATVNLPIGVAGNYFFFVQSDVYDNVYEYIFENNNNNYDTTATNISLTPPPDLEFESLIIPNNARSGENLTINYRVTNYGATETPASTSSWTDWTDTFYLSTDNQLNTASDILLGSVYHYGVLNPDQGYSNSASFALPNTLTGTYYVFGVTDSGNVVFELDNNNNITQSNNQVQIISQPADLVVTNTVIPTTGEAGKTFQVQWAVKNQGTGNTIVNSWSDRIVASVNEVLGDADDIILATFTHTGILDPNATYTRTENVNLPFSLEGNYQLFIATDSDNSVYELSNEGNNNSSGFPVTISRDTPDLQVTSVTLPNSVTSGQPITLSWTVENLGVGRTNSNYWYDEVYLSLDTTLSGDDITLGSFYRSELLNPSTNYTASKAFNLPVDLNGNYYVLVRTDRDNNVIEGALENNNVKTSDSSINISLSSTADLTVQEVLAPEQAIAGQPLSLTWTVGNNGDNTAQTWYDAVYLSRDQVFDRNSDIYLGYRNHTGGLNNGANYTVTESFNVPRGLGGRYYAFVVTDRGNAVYERLGENNNSNYDGFSTEIILPPPADLVVTNITTPNSGIPGENISISYTVQNQGTDTAYGSWKDSIYLSKDTQWDLSDALVGQVNHTGDVAGGASYTGTLNEVVPGVNLGDYYVIVRSDILNQVPEVNEGNNAGVSSSKITLDVEELVVGSSDTDSLSRDKAIFYRIEAQAGETLRVTLDSISEQSANELFIRYGEVPTRGQFDFTGSTPFTTDQEIIIPESQAGTYYVMVYGDSVPEGSVNYTLSAETLPFGIQTLSRTSGGNAGQITLEVFGAKFDEITQIELIQGTNILKPIWQDYVDPTRIRVTFDLTGTNIGKYDLRAYSSQTILDVDVENGKLIEKELIEGDTTFSNIFEVTEGGGGNLETELSLPAAARFGSPFTFLVNVTNTGNNDLNIPVLQVTSPNGTPISLSSYGLDFNSSQEQIMVMGEYRPTVLAPGESVTISMFAKAIQEPSSQFHLDVLSNGPDTALDWDKLESYYRDTTDETTWEQTWTNFKTMVGNSWGELHEAMRLSAADLQLNDSAEVYAGQDLILDLLTRARNGQNTLEGFLSSNINPVVSVGFPLSVPDLIAPESDSISPLSLITDGDPFPSNPLLLPALQAAENYLDTVWIPALTAKFGLTVGGMWLDFIHTNSSSPAPVYHFNDGDSVVEGNLVAKGFKDSAVTQKFVKDIMQLAKFAIQIKLNKGELDCDSLPGSIALTDLLLPQDLDSTKDPRVTGISLYLNWKSPFDIPGNMAGGVGEYGTPPTTFPDIRQLTGNILIHKNIDQCGKLTSIDLTSDFKIHVVDALDFVPGDLGAGIEQAATRPMRFLEENDWAHDVVFTVDFTPKAVTETISGSARALKNCNPQKTNPPANPCAPTTPNSCQPSNVPPGTPPCNPDPPKTVPTVRPRDPNDIIGPAGFGEEGLISATHSLPYIIRFENAADATAPAQTVVITQQLDSDLDWRTFRVDDFGWGDLRFELPADRAFYSQRLDVVEELGFFVDISATIDVITGIATWTLTTIDPETGEIPTNPLIGFLPPDNPNGVGDGFVSYTINARRDAQTGDIIDAEATIVFDTEEPINTPPIFNTLDVTKPTSQVDTLSTITDNPEFAVKWTGTDTGSALATYTIYVSENGGTFTPWLVDTSLTEANYIGTPGNTYAFYSIAEDNAGNRQNIPATYQTITTVAGNINQPPVIAVNTALTLNEGASTAIANTILQVTDSDNSNEQITYTLTDLPDNGSLTLSGIVLALNSTFTQADINNNQLTYEHNGSETISDSFKFTVSDGTGGNIEETSFNLNIVDNDGEIQGKVWNDVNGNGSQDAGEEGLSGWTVYLDTNNNNQLDNGEISTQSDTNGTYNFTELDPGTYNVAQVVQNRWQQTYPIFNTTTTVANIPLSIPSLEIIPPTDDNTIQLNFNDDFRADSRFANTVNQGHSITLTAGQVATNLDFGNQEKPQTSFDIDGNGQYLASVDGLLFYGYLNIRNLPSPDLVNNLTQQLADNLINPDNGATRTTGQAIASYLESNPELMDIDGDGQISAAIDGLLAYGYFNIRNLPSADLVNNLTQQLADNLIPEGSNATRTNGVDIANFLEGYMV